MQKRGGMWPATYLLCRKLLPPGISLSPQTLCNNPLKVSSSPQLLQICHLMSSHPIFCYVAVIIYSFCLAISPNTLKSSLRAGACGSYLWLCLGLSTEPGTQRSLVSPCWMKGWMRSGTGCISQYRRGAVTSSPSDFTREELVSFLMKST